MNYDADRLQVRQWHCQDVLVSRRGQKMSSGLSSQGLNQRWVNWCKEKWTTSASGSRSNCVTDTVWSIFLSVSAFYKNTNKHSGSWICLKSLYVINELLILSNMMHNPVILTVKKTASVFLSCSKTGYCRILIVCATGGETVVFFFLHTMAYLWYWRSAFSRLMKKEQIHWVSVSTRFLCRFFSSGKRGTLNNLWLSL